MLAFALCGNDGKEGGRWQTFSKPREDIFYPFPGLSSFSLFASLFLPAEHQPIVVSPKPAGAIIGLLYAHAQYMYTPGDELPEGALEHPPSRRRRGRSGVGGRRHPSQLSDSLSPLSLRASLRRSKTRAFLCAPLLSWYGDDTPRSRTSLLDDLEASSVQRPARAETPNKVCWLGDDG